MYILGNVSDSTCVTDDWSRDWRTMPVQKQNLFTILLPGNTLMAEEYRLYNPNVNFKSLIS